MLHLTRRGLQAHFDLGRRLGAAFGQAPTQFVQIRRHDKNIGQGAPDKNVVESANVARSLRVDIDQDVDAILQVAQDRVGAAVP